MTLGLESSLPTPLASARLRKKSKAKFGERCEKLKPLVGAPAGKLVFNGVPVVIPLPLVVPEAQTNGDAGTPPVTPLQPTAGSPPKIDRPLVVSPAKPSCVPMSSANERDAETTRASISTCWDFRSNW